MHCIENRSVSSFKYLGDFLIVCTGFTIMNFVNSVLPGLCKSPNFNWEVDDEKNFELQNYSMQIMLQSHSNAYANSDKKCDSSCKHFHYIYIYLHKYQKCTHSQKNPNSLVKTGKSSLKIIILKFPLYSSLWVEK